MPRVEFWVWCSVREPRLVPAASARDAAERYVRDMRLGWGGGTATVRVVEAPLVETHEIGEAAA